MLAEKVRSSGTNDSTTSAPTRARVSARIFLTRNSKWLTAVAVLVAVLVVASVAGVRWLSRAKSDKAAALTDGARALYSSAKFDAAIPDLEESIELDPGSAGPRLLLAQAYEASGDLAKAEAAYRASLRIDPAQPQALYNLAIIHESQGKTAEAIGELERALQADTAFVAARVTLAELYAAKGDKAAARKQYEAVVDMKPLGTDLEAIREKLKDLQ